MPSNYIKKQIPDITFNSGRDLRQIHNDVIIILNLLLELYNEQVQRNQVKRLNMSIKTLMWRKVIGGDLFLD